MADPHERQGATEGATEGARHDGARAAPGRSADGALVAVPAASGALPAGGASPDPESVRPVRADPQAVRPGRGAEPSGDGPSAPGADGPGPRLAKARPRGLNRFSALRNVLVGLRREWCVRFWGMDIHPTVQMSLSAKLDRTFPKGVHVGERSYLAFESRILTHDVTRGLYLHTRVGRNCFVGGRSIILPGIEIGDGCVIGAGAVVTRSVPPGSIVVGNPARVLRSGIETGPYGRLAGADATEAALVEAGLD